MTRIIWALTTASVALVLVAAPVAAQTNTGPDNYPPSGGAAVRDFGAQREGASFTKEDCGFAPGSTAQVSLNGRAITTKAAESDGCVRLSVQIVSRNQVRIDGTTYPANECAENTIRVSGSHRNGGTLAYDNRFRIDCPAAAGAAALPRTGSSTVEELSVAGVGLVLAGVTLAIVARRRRNRADITPAAG